MLFYLNFPEDAFLFTLYSFYKLKIYAIYGPRQKFIYKYWYWYWYIYQLYEVDNDVNDDDGDNGDGDDIVENDDVKTCVAQLVVSQQERDANVAGMQGYAMCGWIMDMDKNTETLKQSNRKT